MNRLEITFKAFVFVGLWLACAFVGQAQPSTAYVSGSGNDANGCSRSAPCKTFKRVMGIGSFEVVVLDSGEYGPVTITRPMKIVAEGAVAEIYSASYSPQTQTQTSAIYIDLTGASGSVLLRGLTLHGNNVTTFAIQNKSATWLYVEDCSIDGFTEDGIYSYGATDIFVKGTTVRNSGGGIYVKNTSTTYRSLVTIDDCRFENNRTVGAEVTGNLSAAIRNSLAAKNGTGLRVESGSQLFVEGCMLWGNTTHGLISSGGTAYVSNSHASNNDYGLSGDNIYTYGNNMLQGNRQAATYGKIIPVAPG